MTLAAEAGIINIHREANIGRPRGKDGKHHAKPWACWHCFRSFNNINKEAKQFFRWVLYKTQRGPKRHLIGINGRICDSTRSGEQA